MSMWRPPVPPFPSTNDPSEVADWVELTVCATGSRFGRGKLQTTMAREDAGDVNVVADIWAELESRARLFDRRWPFRITHDGVEPIARPRSFAMHVFMAALGMRTNIDGAGRELFEHTVAELLRGIVGPNTVRIGAPRRPPIRTSLTDAVRDYFDAAAEDSAILRPFPTTDGDLGLDVAGWMTFSDSRGGYLHLIGQCATGADWPEKLLELNVRKWGDHVNWSVNPVRFFALPFIVRMDQFRRATLDGGLLLDRPRLMQLATMSPISTRLRLQLQRYCTGLYS